MKQVFVITSFLFLVANKEVECRTWRSPSTLLASPKSYSTLTFVRGGSKDTPIIDGVPVVPVETVNDALSSNLQQGVARGGSTTTRKFSKKSVPQPTHLSAASSPLAESSNKNIVEAEAVVSGPKGGFLKRHKSHKHIAKKLKVSPIATKTSILF